MLFYTNKLYDAGCFLKLVGYLTVQKFYCFHGPRRIIVVFRFPRRPCSEQFESIEHHYTLSL